MEHALTLVRDEESALKSLDLRWTWPLIAEAEAAVASGDANDVEAAFARIDRHLGAIG